LVVVGFCIIGYSAFLISVSESTLVEPFGYFIFGLAFVFFGLAFQIMDNKYMETKALELGKQTFSEEKITPTDNMSISTPSQTKLFASKQNKITSELIVKKPKTTRPKEDLFTRPNINQIKGTSMSKRPSQRNEPTQVKIEDLLSPKQKKKKARKIRRAI
jgi:hypothetical protein